MVIASQKVLLTFLLCKNVLAKQNVHTTSEKYFITLSFVYFNKVKIYKTKCKNRKNLNFEAFSENPHLLYLYLTRVKKSKFLVY